jgi:cation transport ATPase
MFGILREVTGIWRRRNVLVREHWYVPLLDFSISTQEFYAAVEKELDERKVPDLEISRVEFAEGGLLSAKRQYLRLRRERLVFDICSAPFGTSWFFSLRGSIVRRTLQVWEIMFVLAAIASLFFLYWWTFGLFIGSMAITASVVAVWVLLYLAQRWQGLDDALMELPIIGVIYEGFFRHETYYREDTRLMYLDIVGRVVRHQMEEFTRLAGLKSLDLKQCYACRPKDSRGELAR